MLETLERRLARLEKAAADAARRADEAMAYAESTARLHHAAICRLHQLAGGKYGWPPAQP